MIVKMTVNCAHQQECSGCQLLGTTYENQLKNKALDLNNLLTSTLNSGSFNIKTIEAGPSKHRDRFDFIIKNNNFGLYNKEKTNIIDLASCEQLSPSLNSWFQKFKEFNFPIEKGSVRLRANSEGTLGAWLDFANLDIKKLLEMKHPLLDILKLSVVEMGQKRKILKVINDELKLLEPEFHPWFETYVQDLPLKLYCAVGSFTQPSIKINKKIQNTLASWLELVKPKSVIEYGSGIGNLSFQLIHFGQNTLLIETDPLAKKSFSLNLEHFLKHPAFSENQKKPIVSSTSFKNFEADLIVVNPPRSGLGTFLNHLINTQPDHVFYMSCMPKTLATDLLQLKQSYTIKEVVLIDQFPQTHHYETLVWLEKK